MKTNLHIVGCPRSGTTLLAEMIATCFKIDGFRSHEESIFKIRPDTSGVYLSKKPNDIVWLDKLLKVDTQLHVIAIVRDPRSVVCSIHAGHPGMYFCNYRVWKRAEESLRGISSRPRVLTITYEHMVSAPDELQKTILDTFPFLVQKHSFSEFHLHATSNLDSLKALGGIRSIDKSRITGWKAHLPRLKQQIRQYPAMLEDLVHLGYEIDNGWIHILDGIEPQTFPCRYSERNEWFKRIEQSIRYRRKIAHYLRQRNLPMA